MRNQLIGIRRIGVKVIWKVILTGGIGYLAYRVISRMVKDGKASLDALNPINLVDDASKEVKSLINTLGNQSIEVLKAAGVKFDAGKAKQVLNMIESGRAKTQEDLVSILRYGYPSGYKSAPATISVGSVKVPNLTSKKGQEDVIKQGKKAINKLFKLKL